ncbi:MAG: NAD(P)/FAD-dependent oxidoreductase [Phycisphaerales bacterium]
MRVAVIGGGISGLLCAFLLAPRHDVALFEREPRLGGHTHTSLVRHEGRDIPVDTGFIVFNRRNYPNFGTLLDRLDVPSRPTTMSFSVRDRNFEFGGSSALGALGSWSNLLSPRWWAVARGVTSLGRQGKRLLAECADDLTITDLIARRQFSPAFVESYLLPMAAAIWSAPRNAILQFPARFFLAFFDNHGMLDLRERPQWRTVVGGSQRYIDAMLPTIARSARLAQGAHSVTRQADGCHIQTSTALERFDEVILATHADDSLTLLADASDAERDILSAMPFQPNDAVLHTDATLLPRRQRCWAAWNYRLSGDPDRPAIVTYDLSLLQGLQTRVPLCLTLNDDASIDPARVLARHVYHHPLYTIAGQHARRRWAEISGSRRTHFCGAYWGNGFHEDGVVSALRVCERFGARL